MLMATGAASLHYLVQCVGLSSFSASDHCSGHAGGQGDVLYNPHRQSACS